MKKILDVIKQYWNIWGSAIVSFLIGWWQNFSKSSMDKTTSFASMFLVMFAVLTVLKTTIKGCKKNLIEKGATSQKQLKIMDQCLNPYKSGETIVYGTIETVKLTKKVGEKMFEKIGKFLKWVWGNKCTILDTAYVLFFATVSNLCAFLPTLYQINWFNDHKPTIQICVPIASILFVIVDLITTYTKYGCETSDELSARLKEKKEKALSKLTPEQRDEVKSQISELKKQLEPMQDQYDDAVELVKRYEQLSKIKDYNLSSMQSQYQEAVNIINSLSGNITVIKNAIIEYKNKL